VGAAHPAIIASRSVTAPFNVITVAAYARIVSAGGASGASAATGIVGGASRGAGQ
jgi:hypothetical protein